MKSKKRFLRAFGVWFAVSAVFYFIAACIFPVDETNTLILPDWYFVCMGGIPILSSVLVIKFVPSNFSDKASQEGPSELLKAEAIPIKVPLSKKKRELLAQDLLSDASLRMNLANKSEFLDSFLEEYDKLLEDFRMLLYLEGKVSFKSSLPSQDYIRLKLEFQWHLRDAIEREYDRIVQSAKGEYRNNHSRVKAMCQLFLEDLELHSCRFDEETTAFSRNILQKLYSQCHVDFPADSHTKAPPSIQTEDFDRMDGHQFEYFCADVLRSNGFINVEVTPGSGDQGVDILAEKDDIRYAIQCKCYSSDLGNKPVQEVNTGKAVYRCQVGAVITNRHFTQGAKDAAAATGVLLWDRTSFSP